MAAEEWEREAANWIAWVRSPRDDDAYALYREAFFELLPSTGAATLEIGCGEGRVARELAARGDRVTGVDAAPTMVSAARLAHPDGEYLVADAAELPFSGGSFDLVVAYNSLMDMKDMPAAVREAARVLEPGGSFCACVLHPMADVGHFSERAAQAPFVIAGSYLEDRRPLHHGQTYERDGLRVTFHGYHYSLEHYARALEDAELVIEALREPAVPAAEVLRDPAEQRWRRVPNFLMFRAGKRRRL